MTELSLAERAVTVGLLVGGLLLLLAASAWAVWPRRVAHAEQVADSRAAVSRAFTWVVIAGLSYSLLGLAAAVREPASAGLTAALLQLLAVLLAAALGAAVLGATDASGPSHRSLSSAAFLVAWVSLVGLPPAVGFHSRILIYRAVLSAGWEWAVAAGMAGSVAALVAAMFAASYHRPSGARGLRVLWIILLLAAVVILGVYPQAGIAVVAPAANLAVHP